MAILAASQFLCRQFSSQQRAPYPEIYRSNVPPPCGKPHTRARQPAKASMLPCREVSDGAQGRNRTTDTVIFSHVLYQLSYLGADLAESEDQGERGGYRGSFLPCPGTGPAARGEPQGAAAGGAKPDSPEFPQVFGT